MPQYGTVWPHRPGPVDDVGRIPDEADALLQDYYMKIRDKGALKLGVSYSRFTIYRFPPFGKKGDGRPVRENQSSF